MRMLTAYDAGEHALAAVDCVFVQNGMRHAIVSSYIHVCMSVRLSGCGDLPDPHCQA